MTLAQQVLALRQFFGTPPDAPLSVAIEMMNVAMGIEPVGLLPQQVQTLCERTGVAYTAAPQQQPAVPTKSVVMDVAVPPKTVPAPAAAASATARQSTAAGKRKASAPAATVTAAAPKKGAVQQSIFDALGAEKIRIPKALAKQVAASNEAMLHEELEAMLVKEYGSGVGADGLLPSERQPQRAGLPCPDCGKLFANAGGLKAHRQWKHPSEQPALGLHEEKLRVVSVQLTAGAGAVTLRLLVNGKTGDEIAEEQASAGAAAAAHEAALVERAAEQDRRRHQRQQQRESEAAVDVVEQRRGSAHRKQCAAPRQHTLTLPAHRPSHTHPPHTCRSACASRTMAGTRPRRSPRSSPCSTRSTRPSRPSRTRARLSRSTRATSARGSRSPQRRSGCR